MGGIEHGAGGEQTVCACVLLFMSSQDLCALAYRPAHTLSLSNPPGVLCAQEPVQTAQTQHPSGATLPKSWMAWLTW